MTPPAGRYGPRRPPSRGSLTPLSGLIVSVAGTLVPRSRRVEWKREWRGELSSLPSADPNGGWRRSLSSFADAIQMRRLYGRPGIERTGIERTGIERTGILRSGNLRPRGLLTAGVDPLQSARRTVRSLLQNPGFSVAAVVTLALAIGANTAIFTLVNAVLLKPPAVEEPGRLVRIYMSTPEGQPFGPSSFLEFEDVRQLHEVFEGVTAYTVALAGLNRDGRIDALIGEVVSGEYFELLGVRPALGRGFLAEESATPGTHPVVVLGHGFWTRRFGADPGIVGRSIRLNGVSFDVIGVAPESYRGVIPGLSVDFWTPAMMIGTLMPDAPEALTSRTSRQFMLHARLRDGIGLQEAAAAVTLLTARLEEAFPESNAGHTMSTVAADSVRLNPRVDRLLLPVAALLLTVVGMVLLIGCTNLAGLLLARASDRRKEIAVRLALGAGRRHIVGQLLSESVLLSLVGGAAGLALASWLVRLIVSFKPPVLAFVSLDLGIDHRVFAFSLGLSIAAGLLFGLAPALRVSNPDLARTLKDEAAVLWRARRLSLRNVLIVGQVAVSMVLLLVAGLFVRSLQSAQAIDPGFDTESSVVFTMNAAIRYDENGGRDYYRRLIDRVRAMPSVTSVALADRLPLGFSQQVMPIVVEPAAAGGGGAPAVPVAGDGIEEIDFGRVAPGYFRTLGIPLLAGRDFDDADRAGAAPVAIVSEATAQRLWPDESPIGKQLRRPAGPSIEVVGMARDTRVRTLGEAPRPYLYLPFAQRYESAMELVIATDRDPATFLVDARDVILQVDPEVVPLEFITMSEGNAVMMFPIRMAAALVGALGLLALLLSSIGVAGSLAYQVARRGHEVGVRLALGASPGRLVGAVVAGGMRLVGVGMAIGVTAALVTTRLLESYLVGISPTDPTAFVSIAVLLAATACVASYIPARRAAGADPLTVLRRD